MTTFIYMKFYYDWCIENMPFAIGLNEDELNSMEQLIGFSFPLAYKEFLIISGKVSEGKGFNFFSSTISMSFEESQRQYSDYIQLDKEGYLIVEGVLATNVSQYKHTGKEIVLSVVREDFQFYFINAVEGENPPIYYCDTVSGDVLKMSNSFTEFISNRMRKVHDYKDST